MANTPTQNFLALQASTHLRSICIAGATAAAGIVATGATNASIFLDMSVKGCGQGFNLSGGAGTSYYFDGTASEACGTGIILNNAHVILYNHTFVGSSALPTPMNTGILATGAQTTAGLESVAFLYWQRERKSPMEQLFNL